MLSSYNWPPMLPNGNCFSLAPCLALPGCRRSPVVYRDEQSTILFIQKDRIRQVQTLSSLSHTYLGFEKRIQFHKYIWKGKSLPRKKTKAGDRGVCGSDSGLALGDRGRKGGAKRACWHGDQAPELRLLSGELGNVDCSGSAPGHPKEVDWSCA